MSEIIVAQRMWQRRDVAANWAAVNPVLAAGEIGVELPATATGSLRLKVGDGLRAWTDLPYAIGQSAIFTVAAAPAASLGNDGDYAINPAGPTLYGPKANGAWPAGIALKGPKGDQGSQGPQGQTGPSGLSAYQVAVANGFSGTAAEWLASLRGAKGDKGDTGPAGIPSQRRVQVVANTDSGSVHCDWSAYDEIRVTLTTDTVFAFSGALDGQGCVLKIAQGGAGNHSVGFGFEVRYNALIAIYHATTTAGKADKVGFVYDGTDGRYDFVSIVPGIG